MSRFVYVVTRIFHTHENFGRSIPNLGVHSNLGRATNHFNSVLADRRRFGKVREMPSLSDDRNPRIRCAMAEVRGEMEEIFIERWKI